MIFCLVGTKWIFAGNTGIKYQLPTRKKNEVPGTQFFKLGISKFKHRSIGGISMLVEGDGRGSPILS